MSLAKEKWMLFLITGCGIALGDVQLALAQRGEDWARFGAGVADALINGGGRNQSGYGSPRGRSHGGHRPLYRQLPNVSQDNLQRPFSLGNNPLFNSSPGYTPSRPNYRPNNTWGGNYRPSWETYRPSYTPSYDSYSDYSPPAPVRVYSGEPIKIRCPQSENGPCTYTLISPSRHYTYTIYPGETQTLREDRAWQIKYDRGYGEGTKIYRLRGGYEYMLETTGDGTWQLYKSSSSSDYAHTEPVGTELYQ